MSVVAFSTPFLAAVLLLLIGGHAALAAEGFTASLQAGDAAFNAKDYATAAREFSAAADQASGTGEKSLALAKQAYIKGVQEDWAGAKALAREALAIEEIKPVGKVTALEVLGRVQMRHEKDFTGAVKTLEEARQLEGVEWAIPIITLMLGDCYRQTGEPEKALTAYGDVSSLNQSNPFMKATASLCAGLTQQYDLRDVDKAKVAYAKAVQLNPGLKKEVDAHLSKLQ